MLCDSYIPRLNRGARGRRTAELARMDTGDVVQEVLIACSGASRCRTARRGNFQGICVRNDQRFATSAEDKLAPSDPPLDSAGPSWGRHRSKSQSDAKASRLRGGELER